VRSIVSRDGPTETDPDLMIYSGGFFSDADRRAMDAIHRLDPAELSDHAPSFQDPRLGEMLLRYRARNWPETLTPEEREDWDLFRLARLTDPAAGGSIVIEQFEQCLSELAEQYAGRSGQAANPRRPRGLGRTGARRGGLRPGTSRSSWGPSGPSRRMARHASLFVGVQLEGQVDGAPAQEPGGQGHQPDGAEPILGIDAPADDDDTGDDTEGAIECSDIRGHRMISAVLATGAFGRSGEGVEKPTCKTNRSAPAIQ
jgi:hypothetical protein